MANWQWMVVTMAILSSSPFHTGTSSEMCVRTHTDARTFGVFEVVLNINCARPGISLPFPEPCLFPFIDFFLVGKGGLLLSNVFLFVLVHMWYFFCFFFGIRKKVKYIINKICKEGWMQAGIVQKGYVHPRWNPSTKSITSKED